MAKQSVSKASQLYFGSAYSPKAFAVNERVGVPFNPLTKVSLGSPAVLDADGLIVAATGTELPDTETVTYTPATDGTSPLDGAIAAPSTVFLAGADRSVWVLDVPRNITGVVSHAGTSVAMTVLISGYDYYGQAMSELLTFGASASDVPAAGAKAFKYISSIAITAAADAEANTLNMGWGDVLGLPYALPAKSDFLTNGCYFNEVLEGTAPAVVAAVTTTATTTTGDVRGTVDLNSACDGSAVSVWYKTDPTSEATLFGVAQA